MSFSERSKAIALAIVKIFETSKPWGDYSAVAVLDDGAGISYGISQFTHKSGSLYAVVMRFFELGGIVPDAIDKVLPELRTKTKILATSNNKTVRTAFRNLGKDPLMQQAQREIAFEKYLKPALDACEGSDFNYPLSLAVIYDSINHGSYDKIRDKVKIAMPGNGSMKPEEFERLWITQYTRKRDEWLESVPRLAKTDYRTDFFLAQIARGNWHLKLPMTVHGFTLTESMFPEDSAVPQLTPESAPTPTDNPTVDATKAAETKEPDASISETKTTEIVQTGDTTHAVETTQPKGDAPDATPTKVSTGGPLARWLFSGGVLTSLATSVWAFVTANGSVIAIAVVCITVLIIVLIFRGAITDAIRMQTAADPDKKNVT